MPEPKITLLDIESCPTLAYVWQMYEADVIAVKEDWFMLSYAYRTLGNKIVQCKCLPDFKGYEKDHQNDRELVRHIWEVLDGSDVIIAHNGDRFDLRKINARFVFHGLKPPSPYISIDTLKIARRYFKFDSNKLDLLAEYLGVGKKLPTLGFKKTWLGCMAGDKTQWGMMRRYNKHDIELLEGVYLKLRPWAKNHPRLSNFHKGDMCPNCQSGNIQYRGFSYTRTGKRRRYCCKDCGAWETAVKLERTI
jgi:hypothetical protein